jgi:hypothetical protein
MKLEKSTPIRHMNTYYIDLYGKGHIICFFPINEKQKKQLNKIGITDDNSDFEADGKDLVKIKKLLNVEYLGNADVCYSGAYLECFALNTYDVNEECIWVNEENFENISFQEIESDAFDVTHTLIIDAYVKGDFSRFTLKTEEDFNPAKLQCKCLVINEDLSIIVGLLYAGAELAKEEIGCFDLRAINCMLT